MASLLGIVGALALTLVVFGVRAFNIDIEHGTAYRGDPDSMFGFSVALHREKGQSWVLVGAPRAQTPQPDVLRGGAVYACDVSRSECTQVPFDPYGDNIGSDRRQLDSKSDQWFGASLYSSGVDGPVVACAPRYIFYSLNKERREPVGTCYLARNLMRNISEYAPCRTGNYGPYKQGSCQAGLGVAISKDGERLFIGAVGSYYWQGELYSIDDHAVLLFVPPLTTYFDDEGMLISQTTHPTRYVVSTKEGPETEDDSYLGYSVAVGDFGGNEPGHGDVAVGRPRGADLLGQVLLFTWNLTSIQNITGEQLGSYFGYAITVSDVDGDGRDDLIIGAPLYTELQNSEGKYETGRVYIIYQGTQSIRFNQLHIKDGQSSKGRFGLALTSLGDINKDSYGDFAVGAPYDGKDERGAVYIFHGSAAGVRDSYSQVIYAEDIVGSPFTFGFSLSGGVDLDENDYPDLVIGAYDSNTAVFLRTRPVVKVDAKINFISEGKQIALEETNCTLRDRTKVPCIQLSSCLQYDGIGVEKRLDFEIQFVLDSKKPKNPRMFFISDENRSSLNQSLRLYKGEQTCKDMYVYMKTNIRDKLTPIEAEIRYALLGNYTSRRRQNQLAPILNLNEALSRKDSILIRKNCGNDNICIPDLRLTVQPSVKRYLLGSGERFQLNVLVTNSGEDAFEAVFETKVPIGMNYVKIERMDQAEREIPVQCSPPSFLNNNTLHCDIGNPLPGGKLVNFNVIMQPFHQDGMKPRYEFEMLVNSTNPENRSSESDNLRNITVPIWVETDLILQGTSHPEEVRYNSSLYYKTDNFTHESEIGPQVIHVYEIRNKGPSDIVEAEAYFLWPSYTLAGDHLMYLLEQPEVFGNVRCEHVEEVNVEHLVLDRKRKGFLDTYGDTGIQSSLTKTDSPETSASSHKSSSTHTTSGSTYSETHSSSTFTQTSGKVLTVEERKKLEEEYNKRELEKSLRESGDTSFSQHGRHKHRNENTHYSSNGGLLISDSHSKDGYVSQGGQVENSNTQESTFTMQGTHRGQNTGSTSFHRGHGGRGHVHYEEREQVSNSTWKSGEVPQTVTHTRWTTVDDGVKKNVDSTNVQSGIIAGNINLSNLGLSSSGNRRYTIGGGGGSRVYTEERHYEKNTTWNSREGVPKVSESSNWKINDNGNIRTGGTRTGSDQTLGGNEFENRDRFSGSSSGTRQSSHHGFRQGTIFSDEHTISGSGSATSVSRDSASNVHNEGHSSGTQSGNFHEVNVNRDTSVSSNGGFNRENGRRVYTDERQYETHNFTVNSDSRAQKEEDTHGSSNVNFDQEHSVRSHGNFHDININRGTSVNTNMDHSNRDYDRRVYTNERQPVTSNFGSVLTVNSGSRVQKEEEIYGGSSVQTNGQNVGIQQVINREGVIHEGISTGTRISNEESGSTRHEGRHKVHWSSSDSRVNYDDEDDNTRINVGEEITHVLGGAGVNRENGNNQGKTIEEEHHHEWNTTWNSGGRPKTTEHVMWSLNEDGSVRNGSYTNTYEGGAHLDKDMNKHVLISNIETGGANEDHNLVGTGHRGTTYSEEKVSTYNTTWNSASGNKPVTTAHTEWKVNKDGVISSGSKSDVFEGTPHLPLPGHESESALNRGYEIQTPGQSYGTRAQENANERNYGSTYEINRQSGRGSTHVQNHGSTYEANRESGSASTHNRGHSSHHIHLSGEEDDGFDRSNVGMSGGERRFEESSSSVNVNHGERTGSHHQTGTVNINVGDLLRGSKSSSGSDDRSNYFGQIARGPKDGVAKTYALDLGINSESNSGTETRHHEHSGHHRSAAGGASQGSYLSQGQAGRSYADSQGYSYRNEERIERTGSSHNSWTHPGGIEVADSTNPQHGGAYGIRRVSDAPYPRHVSDESHRGQFQLYPRYKRQAGEENFEESLKCGPTDCTKIKCTVGPLKKDEEVWVAFRSRVWVSTIRKISTNVEVGLSSLVAARVTVLPHIGSPDVVTTHTHEIHSRIMPPDSDVKPDIIPLWIVVVSACAGAIILMLLIYLLYKCGFFKRNRPSSSAPEKQPLNRNGHYHDEAL